MSEPVQDQDAVKPGGAEDQVRAIMAQVAGAFRTFGGGKTIGGGGWNPISDALKDDPLAFAAMVPVEEVVRFVLACPEAGMAVADPRDKTIAVLKGEVERLAFLLRKAGELLPANLYTGEIGHAAYSLGILASLEAKP